MDYKLELVVVPVSDVDRAKAFYTDQLGFDLDVDHRAGDAFRIVQLTPRGSTCSIAVGVGITEAAAGSAQGLHLVVRDIETAQAELSGRGLDVGEVWHFDESGRAPGPDPNRSDYNSFLFFRDPDGNGWAVQEVGHGRGAGG